jgi:MFS family permease
MRAHWRTVLGVSLVVALITQAISTVISWWAFNGIDDDLDRLENDPDPTFDETMDVFGGVFAGLGVAQIITLLGTLVVTAMLTIVVSRSVLGRPVTTADAWNDAKPQLGRLLGLTFLVPLIGAAVLAVALLPGVLALVAGSDALGATLLVLGGIAGFGVAVWLLIRLSLSSPTLMLEKQGVRKAMTRSTKLVRGSWWRVFGIQLLSVIITTLVASVVQTPFTVLSLLISGDTVGGLFTGEASSDLGIAALTVTGIGAALGMTVAFPISAGVATLLYIDQRIRREALDLELARAAGVPVHGDQAPGPGHPAGGPAVPGS